MTPVHMTASQFKRLAKKIVPRGMSKSDLMTLHLLLVEAMLGRRITPQELQSARFTESRNEFLSVLLKWREKGK